MNMRRRKLTWISHSFTCCLCQDALNGDKLNTDYTFTGCDEDIKYILKMRENTIHYVSFIDMFAPCVVSVKKWDNVKEMETACTGADGDLFNKMLTISDEAFMLLVMENYATKWFAENILQQEKVRISECM